MYYFHTMMTRMMAAVVRIFHHYHLLSWTVLGVEVLVSS
jgi:hypothetical protein